MMSWLCAPPSDQESNSNGKKLRVWSAADRLIRSPWMSWRVNGVVPTPRASTLRPDGTELTVTVATFGKIDTVWLVWSPPESVTVTVSCRYEGNSCAGPVNEPEEPLKVPVGCSWQLPGQCSTTRLHENALSGSTPSSGSAANAAKSILSPTENRCVADGAVMITPGAELPAVTTWVVVPGRFLSSRTRSLTVTAPLAVYVRCGVAL